MILYFEGLLVGIAGITIWVFFWRLSENFSENAEFPLGVPMVTGAITFVLSFLSTIGNWLDLCIANGYGVAIGVIGIMLSLAIECLAGVTIGLLPFSITNKVKFCCRKFRYHKRHVL